MEDMHSILYVFAARNCKQVYNQLNADELHFQFPPNMNFMLMQGKKCNHTFHSRQKNKKQKYVSYQIEVSWAEEKMK